MLDMLLFGFVMLLGFMVSLLIVGIILINELMSKIKTFYIRERDRRRYHIDL